MNAMVVARVAAAVVVVAAVSAKNVMAQQPSAPHRLATRHGKTALRHHVLAPAKPQQHAHHGHHASRVSRATFGSQRKAANRGNQLKPNVNARRVHHAKIASPQNQETMVMRLP